jgi:hypothetical protein
MSSLTDRLRAFDPGSRRFAPRDAAASRPDNIATAGTSDDSAARGELDAEMLDVVDKFEAAYSELVPPTPAPAAEDARTDAGNLDIDLLDEELRKAFGDDEPPEQPPSRSTVHRTFDSGPPVAVRGVAPREEADQNLSFEDAMATLRASEARGKATTVQRADDAGSLPRVERQQHAPAYEARQALGSDPADVSPAESLAANESWTTRSRKVWPKVAAAAGLALVIGSGVGYIAGKKPGGGAPAATIPTTPEGGARLRFDYDLQRR